MRNKKEETFKTFPKHFTKPFVLSFKQTPFVLLQSTNTVNGCPPNTIKKGEIKLSVFSKVLDGDQSMVNLCRPENLLTYETIIRSSRKL